MNTLIAIRTNDVYQKNQEGEEIKFTELVFIVDEPGYQVTNENEVVRKRKAKTVRLFVSENNFDALIGQLVKIRKGIESENK